MVLIIPAIHWSAFLVVLFELKSYYELLSFAFTCQVLSCTVFFLVVGASLLKQNYWSYGREMT